MKEDMEDDKIEKILVLTKEVTYDDNSSYTTILGAYRTMDEVDKRMQNIQEANSQYPMEYQGRNTWRLGPTEDEGFYGNRPYSIRVVETVLS